MVDAFRIGAWLVEPEMNRLSYPAGETFIEPKSMALLVYLAKRQGEVVSADDFITVVWGGRAMGDNPVYKTVAKLRKALGESGGNTKYIETISKKGYCLVCPVEPTGADAQTNLRISPSPTNSVDIVKTPFSWRGPIVAALASVLAVLVVFFLYRQFTPAAPAAPVSIAVLPFTNFGDSNEDTYFVDGLAEEILNRLAQSPDLRVVARTSSFQFRDQSRNIGEIGAALGAAYLIEGSVRRDDENLRVTAQLVDAKTGYHLWSDTFDNKRSDIFFIQDKIALAVADALDASILNSDALVAPTNDLDAWAMYLEGKALWQRKGEGPIRASIRLFENAVERDPEFAEAWAALSEAWIVLPRYAQKDLETYVANGKEAAEHAVSLDPLLAQPYLSLAAYEDLRREYAAGIAYTERAFALTPHHTGVLNTMSFNYARAGWIDEAIIHSRNGVDLDPLEGGEYITLGFLSMVAGDYDGARATFLRGWNDLGVKAYFLWEGLFEIHILKGEFDAAEEWLDVRPSQRGVALRQALIDGLRNSNPGDREQAIATMIDAVKTHKAQLHEMFDYLLILGAEDQAFEIAQTGIGEGSYFMVHHLYKPTAQSLRRQPRVLELAEALGIAQLWRTTGRMPDFCKDVAQYYDCETELKAIEEKRGP